MIEKNKSKKFKGKTIWINKNGSVDIFDFTKEEINTIAEHSVKAELDIIKSSKTGEEHFRTITIGSLTLFGDMEYDPK